MTEIATPGRMNRFNPIMEGRIKNRRAGSASYRLPQKVVFFILFILRPATRPLSVPE
jgi:hypothetical protein